MANPRTAPKRDPNGVRRKQRPAARRTCPRKRLFPHQLRPGDRHLDDEGHEWEVLDHPAVYRQGTMVEVRPSSPASKF